MELMRLEDKDSREIEAEFFATDKNSGNKSSLVIATFNIRYAVGAFLITGSFLRRIKLGLPRRRPALVARHLKIAAEAFAQNRIMPVPDIIALQEADKHTARSGGHSIARKLASALKMNYARAAMRGALGEMPKPRKWYLDFEEHIAQDETGDTGVAILTRLPFTDVARIELPFYECTWRPRLAIRLTVEHNNRRIHVFNAHIDPHATQSQQRAQHEKILEKADDIHDPNDLIVLLGDFNTLTQKSRADTRRFLESRGYKTVLPDYIPTWRAGLLRNHTDWIFTRGDVLVSRWGVARPLGVSDHWPVWIEIDTARNDK
jgi:endonuclease/exonuclease/phosphatase family metal-dependent hydrolase